MRPDFDAHDVPAALVAEANALAWQRWRTTGARTGADWLAGRGIDAAAAAAAGWPPAAAGPGWQETTSLLRRHGVPLSAARAAGLVRLGQEPERRPYDGFRGRAVFPVRSADDGAVLGFTARTLGRPDERTPKYINSPANALYRKSAVVFGAWEALGRAAAGGLEALVLVEGPMDAISVGARGPWAGLAPCGTALTAPQAELIAAVSAGTGLPVILAYDGDEAGQAAEWRAWEMLRPLLGGRMRMSDIPAGRDPGDLDAGELAAALADHRARERRVRLEVGLDGRLPGDLPAAAVTDALDRRLR